MLMVPPVPPLGNSAEHCNDATTGAPSSYHGVLWSAYSAKNSVASLPVGHQLGSHFHLSKTSLLLLISAFAGKELALAAYRHAVAERHRFYSYGDCMLIV